MRSYLLRRIAFAIPVILCMSMLVFLLLRVTPGDPIASMLGVANYDPDTAAALRHQLGLDRSIVDQYILWLGRALTGDIGFSLRTRQPVMELVLQALPVTLLLGAASMLFALILGGITGLVGAVKRGSPLDSVGSMITVAGLAIPNYWLAILLIYVVALKLDALPPAGFVPLAENPGGAIAHLVLPAFCLSLRSAAVIGRMLRSSLLEVLGEDYVRTARAKGLSETAVIGHHALSNAMIPMITIIGIQAGTLIGSTVIIETIFAYPGLGKLVADAIFARDYPVVQGAVLFISVGIVGLNVLVDALYSRLDPRIGGG